MAKHLLGSEILQLQGAPPEVIAEYVKFEKEMRYVNSWRGRLVLWWRQHFPPKSWTYVCSNCGKRTSDRGDEKRLPICSRPSCKQKYIDAVAVEPEV